MKLISLNVSLFDENNDKISAFLKRESPDVVCLQEVTRKVDEGALDTFITKTAVDKGTSNLEYSFYTPNWALRDIRLYNFHGKKKFEHDFRGLIECGNYVRSRFEILDGKSIFLQGHFSYVADWDQNFNHPGQEPRTVQVVDLKTNEKRLRILNYHGIWSRDKKDTQQTKLASKKILELALEVDYPTIICGDFNLFPDTESIKILENNFQNLIDHFEINNTRPKSNELNGEKRNVVDYIFVSKGIKVVDFKVIETEVSDHFPLFLEFDI